MRKLPIDWQFYLLLVLIPGGILLASMYAVYRLKCKK